MGGVELTAWGPSTACSLPVPAPAPVICPHAWLMGKHWGSRRHVSTPPLAVAAAAIAGRGGQAMELLSGCCGSWTCAPTTPCCHCCCCYCCCFMLLLLLLLLPLQGKVGSLRSRYLDAVDRLGEKMDEGTLNKVCGVAGGGGEGWGIGGCVGEVREELLPIPFLAMQLVEEHRQASRFDEAISRPSACLHSPLPPPQPRPHPHTHTHTRIHPPPAQCSW